MKGQIYKSKAHPRAYITERIAMFERNRDLTVRYLKGGSILDLAKDFGISAVSARRAVYQFLARAKANGSMLETDPEESLRRVEGHKPKKIFGYPYTAFLVRTNNIYELTVLKETDSYFVVEYPNDPVAYKLSTFNKPNLFPTWDSAHRYVCESVEYLVKNARIQVEYAERCYADTLGLRGKVYALKQPKNKSLDT